MHTMCVCDWTGDSFDQHHRETQFEDTVHVEVSPLMMLAMSSAE